MYYKNRSFLFAFIFMFAFISFASALPTVAPSSFSINESATNLYNITINNSEAASANITQVNITLPAGFYFVSGSNGSSNAVADLSFVNSSSSNSLSWSSTLAVQNFTNQSFWFNAVANTTTLGTFNISVILVNNTAVTTYNISVTVSDASPPNALSYVSPSSANGVNVTSYFVTNITSTDNFNVSQLRFYLYNSAGTLINNTNFSNNYALLNYSLASLSDGLYYFNATAVDNAGNINQSIATRTFRLDTTGPTITLTKNSSETTATTIYIKVEATDSGSGLSSCSIDTYTSNSDWTTSPHQVSESKKTSTTNLACGQSAGTRTVTCVDNLGNSNTATISPTSSACSVAASSSSSSSSSTTNVTAITWTSTFYQSTKELSVLGEVKQSLAKYERVGVKVSSAIHYVGVANLGSSYADIQVQSTIQTAKLDVGETNKFELTGDNYYDLSVTLDSIKNSKANFTILAINEKMPSTNTSTTTAATTTRAATTSVNSSSANTIANATTNASTSNSPSLGSKFKNLFTSPEGNTLVWWSVGILVILVAVAVVWVILLKRKKNKHN